MNVPSLDYVLFSKNGQSKNIIMFDLSIFCCQWNLSEGYLQIHVNFYNHDFMGHYFDSWLLEKEKKIKVFFFSPRLFLYKNPIIHVIKNRRLDSTIWSSL